MVVTFSKPSNPSFKIKFLEYSKKYEILMIPTTKTIPKKEKQEYIKEIN